MREEQLRGEAGDGNEVGELYDERCWVIQRTGQGYQVRGPHHR